MAVEKRQLTQRTSLVVPYITKGEKNAFVNLNQYKTIEVRKMPLFALHGAESLDRASAID